MRMRTFVLVALALAAAALPAAADPLTPEQKDAVEQLIRNTIAEHPEIVIDALKAAQAKTDAEAAQNVKTAIAAGHDQLVADPTSPVAGNPKGDVTIVEFFDYRCPYCKEVEPSLEALVKDDRSIRHRLQGVSDPGAGLGLCRARGARGARAGQVRRSSTAP